MKGVAVMNLTNSSYLLSNLTCDLTSFTHSILSAQNQPQDRDSQLLAAEHSGVFTGPALQRCNSIYWYFEPSVEMSIMNVSSLNCKWWVGSLSQWNSNRQVCCVMSGQRCLAALNRGWTTWVNYRLIIQISLPGYFTMVCEAGFKHKQSLNSCRHQSRSTVMLPATKSFEMGTLQIFNLVWIVTVSIIYEHEQCLISQCDPWTEIYLIVWCQMSLAGFRYLTWMCVRTTKCTSTFFVWLRIKTGEGGGGRNNYKTVLKVC